MISWANVSGIDQDLVTLLDVRFTLVCVCMMGELLLWSQFVMQLCQRSLLKEVLHCDHLLQYLAVYCPAVLLAVSQARPQKMLAQCCSAVHCCMQTHWLTGVAPNHCRLAVHTLVASKMWSRYLAQVALMIEGVLV